jgi:hypothetical protein
VADCGGGGTLEERERYSVGVRLDGDRPFTRPWWVTGMILGSMDKEGRSLFIGLVMEAVHTSETSVYSETVSHYIPDGSNLHTHCHENLKSHKGGCIKHSVYNEFYLTSVLKSSFQCRTPVFLSLSANFLFSQHIDYTPQLCSLLKGHSKFCTVLQAARSF